MTVHDYLTRCGGQLAPMTGVITGLPTATGLGLTVRDYFAAAALTGLLANDPCDSPEAFATNAYRVADAMLAERSNVLPAAPRPA
jgi:hypothetical protein